MALLDVKRTGKTRPRPGKLLWSGRFANNRTHVRHYWADAPSQAGWGVGPARGLHSVLHLWFSHVLCFLCLFRLSSGWKCVAPRRALGLRVGAGLPRTLGQRGWCPGGCCKARGEKQGPGNSDPAWGALPSSPRGDLPISRLAQACGHCPPTGLLEGPGSWGPLKLLVLCSGPSLEEGDRGMARASVFCLMAEPAFRLNT